MSDHRPRRSSHLTLGLLTLLHAFTHAYGTILAPLYLLMADDLNLKGEKEATFVVTVYMLVYCLGSIVSGILADRFNRKWLLGVGLLKLQAQLKIVAPGAAAAPRPVLYLPRIRRAT